MKGANGKRRAGLSILEVIVSTMLVSTILLVSLTASANVLRNRTLAAEGMKARRLAGYFVDEIATLDFEDSGDAPQFGPEDDEDTDDRTTMDDVDDFHNYWQVTPTFRDGTAIPDYEDWLVAVGVERYTYENGAFSSSNDSDAPLRVVTVYSRAPEGLLVFQRTLVSNTPQSQSTSVSFERLRRVELSFPDNRQIDVVVPLRNGPHPNY